MYLILAGANIFLSSDSVKLGDFGLSVQLKNVNKTQPNEIKHQRGTIRKQPYLIQNWTLWDYICTLSLSLSLSPAYMAPEVILKQNMGQAMDVWAIGCVVVEMITSKASKINSNFK